MDTKHVVLLCFGLIALIKAVWIFAAPDSMRRWAEGWSRVVGKIHWLMAVLCVLLAVGIWALILINQSLADWLLGLLGLCFAGAGIVYLNVESVRKIIYSIAIDRGSFFLRMLSLIGFVIAAVFIWVAVTGA